MSTHVIIQSVSPRLRYISNGTLATYTFPFAIFKNSDLKVYFGATLQDATTYSVSGAGQSSGGSVTLSNVPASGTIITLTRELAIERTSDFQEGGALRADTLNTELDYQIACQQQIADNLNRSMVLPPYAADTNVNLTLPLPSAGKAIVWNAAGTNLENSTVSVNAMESTLNGYKTAAETAATTATTKANEATTQAQTATAQATTATEQATIATQKAQEVSVALSTKANLAMDNLSAAGKKVLANMPMPSDNYIDFVLPAAGLTTTDYGVAPANGYLFINSPYVSQSDAFIRLTARPDGTTTSSTWYAIEHFFYGSIGTGSLLLPVARGSQMELHCKMSWNSSSFIKFIYAQGEI